MNLVNTLKILLFSMLPIIELRGAIPYAVALGYDPGAAFLLAFVGSLLPIPLIFFGVRPFFKRVRTLPFLMRIVHKVKKKANVDGRKVIKYGFWGLILLVAIPLPGTGVWSGTLAASLLDMRFKSAFPAIVIGNIIAGILVLLMTSTFF